MRRHTRPHVIATSAAPPRNDGGWEMLVKSLIKNATPH